MNNELFGFGCYLLILHFETKPAASDYKVRFWLCLILPVSINQGNCMQSQHYSVVSMVNCRVEPDTSEDTPIDRQQ